MAQTTVSDIAVALRLNSASFTSEAEKARVAFQRSMGGIQQDVKKSSVAVEGLTSGLKGFAAGLAGALSIGAVTQFSRAIVEAGDKTQQLRAKLNQSFGEGGLEQARKSAMALGVSTESVAGTMARLSNALKEVGATNSQVVKISETLVRMGRIAGSTGQEIESALTQFSQGLAKGRLDGDELKGVLEAMPPVARLLAKEMGVSVGALRDLGAEGKITSDVIVRAFEAGAADITRQFEMLPESLDQATARMQNSFLQLFASVDQSFNASGFVKFLMGGIGDAASTLGARLNVANAVPGQPTAVKTLLAEQTKNKADLDKLIAGRGAAEAGGATSVLSSYDKSIEDLTNQQQLLATAIDIATKAQDRQNASLQHAQEQAAQFKGNFPVPEPGAKAQPTLYPVRTIKDEEALKGYRDDAKHAASQKATEAAAAADRAAGKAAAASAKQASAAAALASKKELLISRIQQETDASEDLVKAASLTETAYKKQKAANDDAKRVLEASRVLKGKELEDYKKLSAAIAENEKRVLALNAAKERGTNDPLQNGLRRQAETESLGKLDTYNQDQTGKALEDQQRIAEQQSDVMQDILAQPWRDLAGEVAQISTDIWADFLEKGQISAGKVFGGLRDTLNTSAAGLLGNITTAPIQQGLAGLASGQYGSISEFAGTTQGKTALAGAGGYALGTGVDLVRGEQTYAATGGAIGGVVGAGVGSFFGPAGTVVGGAVGGLAGTAIGSFFGAGDDLGNDRSAEDYFTGAGKTVYSDESYSSGNRSITSGILGEVQSLQKGLEGLGATIGGLVLNVGAGNESGITVNDQKYGTSGEAVVAALKKLIGSTSGLSATQSTVLKNTDAASAQGVIADLDFGKQFDRLTFSGTQLQQAILDINEAFAGTITRAKQLGLDEKKLTAARDEQIRDARKADADIRASFQAHLNDLFANSSFNSALTTLNQQFDELKDQADQLGYSSKALTSIESLRAREQKKLFDAERERLVQQREQIAQAERQIRGQQRGLVDFDRGNQNTFQGLIDPLRQAASNDNRLSPLGQISQARNSFRSLLGQAKGGDVQAIQQLAGSAQQLQGLSSQYLGSGGMGASIAAEIQKGLNSVVGQLETQQESLPDVQRQTTQEIIRNAREDREAIVEELARLRRELANLRKAA